MLHRSLVSAPSPTQSLTSQLHRAFYMTSMTTAASPMRARTPPTPTSQPSPAKRSRISHDDEQPEAQTAASTSSLPTSIPQPISTSPLDFSRGLFLAPMVRIGGLPTRLLSLYYGADLVWSAETIDKALIGCEREIDPLTGVINYHRNGKSIFATHPIERDRLLLQIGSSTPEIAASVVRQVTGVSDAGEVMRHSDVAGVCLNCGCPKHFSISGGMGAALLSDPDKLCSILVAMRTAAPPDVAVHVKIRMLPTDEETLALVRRIVDSNTVDAITVHCRTKEMRPREDAMHHRLAVIVREVKERSGGRIPVVANGDVWGRAEARKIMLETGVRSVMVARAGEGNVSMFRSSQDGGLASVPEEVGKKFAQYAFHLKNHVANTRYCLQTMQWPFKSHPLPPSADNTTTHTASDWPKKRVIAVRDACTVKAKTAEDTLRAFGIDVEQEKKRDLKEVLSGLVERLRRKDVEGPDDLVGSGIEPPERPALELRQGIKEREPERAEAAINIVEQGLAADNAPLVAV